MGSSMIRVSLLVLMAIVVQTSLAQTNPQEFLDGQNSARAEVGVGPLEWNDTLALYAQQYASSHVDACGLVHSGGPYGENLAGSTGDLNGTEAVKLWVNEGVDYDYDSNTCAPEKVCGHYTQVVWRNSVRIGCAKVRCNDGGTFIGCNYDPPGNFIGEKPY